MSKIYRPLLISTYEGGRKKGNKVKVNSLEKERKKRVESNFTNVPFEGLTTTFLALSISLFIHVFPTSKLTIGTPSTTTTIAFCFAVNY